MKFRINFWEEKAIELKPKSEEADKMLAKEPFDPMETLFLFTLALFTPVVSICWILVNLYFFICNIAH